MATQRDEDRPGREYGRTLITACGVLLASASLAALVLADNAKQLRLAVVGALWAFLLVSITGRFRSKAEETPGDSDQELRRFYQMELQQEVAARREYELRLEVQMRRELEETRTQELEQLRAEVHRLRAELMGIEAPDRAALLAQAAGLSPERLRVLQEEARRPAEPPQLPAGFSDSPPVDPTPSYPSVPSYGSDPAGPRLVAQGAELEPYSATEFIPAGAHGAPRESSYHPTVAASTPAEVELPAAAHGSAEISGGYPAREAHPASTAPTGPAGPTGPSRSQEFGVMAPYGAPESSGTFDPSTSSPVPSPAWSSYLTPSSPSVPPAPPAPSPVAPPTRRAAPPAPPLAASHNGGGPNHGPASNEGYGSSASYLPPQTDRSRAGYSNHRAPEPDGPGRHGTPAEVSRPDPFDPSNTWPGAFQVSHEERSPAPSTAPETSPYPTQQANWRPAEQPAEWRPAQQPAEWRPAETTSRGRHHAGDEPTEDKPGGPTRPEDDVLAQILGRW